MRIKQKIEKVLLIAQKCLTVDDFIRFICGAFWLVALRIFILFLVLRQVGRSPNAQLSEQYFPFLFIGLIFVSTLVSVYALTMKFLCDEKKRDGLSSYEATATRLLGVLLYSFFIFVVLEIIIVFPIYYLFAKTVLGIHVSTAFMSSIIPLIICCVSSLLILLGCVLIGCSCIVYYGFIPLDGWTSVYVLNILSGAICAVDRLPEFVRQISVLIPFSHGLTFIRRILLYNICPDIQDLIIYCVTGVCSFLLGLGCYLLFMQKARARGLL